jgi:surface protein
MSNFDTSYVDSMYSVFNDCINLKEIKGIENFDTSNVTNMVTMFRNCKSLKTLDLRNFSFDKVTSYSYIFENVGSNLPAGTYTTVYVKGDYELDGTTYSPQTWVINNGRSGWSTTNVIVKN